MADFDRDSMESLSELLGGWFWECDASLSYTYLSPNFELLTNMSRSEWLGRRLGELTLHDPMADADTAGYKEAIDHREPFTDFVVLNKSGSGDTWISMSGLPSFNEATEFTGYCGMARDITFEHLAKRQIEHLTFAIGGLHDAFCLWDKDDRLSFYNDAFLVSNDSFSDQIRIGMTYTDFLKLGLAKEEYPDAKTKQDRWLEDMLARHRAPHGPYVIQRPKQKFYQISEQLHDDGSISTIGVDISPLKRAEEALSTALDRAETASKAKSEFLSSMSHELRTPLNAIMGFSQLLQFDPANPMNEPQAMKVEQIMLGAQQLLDLINDILEMSQMEAGETRINMDEVPITPVLDECIDMIMPEAVNSGVSIVKEYESTETQLYLDPKRLRQIVLNLLSNAVKYNRESGQVTLATQFLRNGVVRISVTDTGEGIPEAQHSQIFLPFNRLGREATNIKGTGIGLSISQRLAEMMEGQLSFESEVGVGTTFHLDFFRKTEGDEETDDLVDDLEEAEVDPASTIILYVEDNPANVELMRQIILQLDNIEFHTVRTAELGLALAERYKPSLILMDINLPGMDGFAALDRLHSNDNTKDIPVVAISADGTAASIQRGMDAGFHNYLVKPFNVGEVVRTVLGSVANDD